MLLTLTRASIASVTRQRRLSVFMRKIQAITAAVNGMHHLDRKWPVDGVADRVDMRPQRIALRRVIAPDLAHDLCATHNAMAVTHQQGQDLASRSRQIDPGAGAFYAQGIEVVLIDNRQMQPGDAILGEIQGVSPGLEELAEVSRDIAVVIDNQDTHNRRVTIQPALEGPAGAQRSSSCLARIGALACLLLTSRNRRYHTISISATSSPVRVTKRYIGSSVTGPSAT